MKMYEYSVSSVLVTGRGSWMRISHFWLCQCNVYSSPRRRATRYRLNFWSTRLQPELEKSFASIGKYSSSSAMLSTRCSRFLVEGSFLLMSSSMHILTCCRSRGRKGTNALIRFLSITLLYFKPPIYRVTQEVS